MKITSLLSQYLYTHHRLDLPGIGTFLLDPSAIQALENVKQRAAVLEGISFQNNPSIKESPELVAYISAQTGKMKPLAASDLESFIEIAQQFLNIGKPYTLDGIGTLVKTNLKDFEFIPIAISAEKVKEQLATPKEIAAKASAIREEAQASAAPAPQYESFLTDAPAKKGWKKPAIALALIAGLGLTIWGGYAISKNMAAEKASTSVVQEEPAPQVDSSALLAVTPDTLANETPVIADNYKYVLEEAPKQRIIKRYNQLRTNLWDVKLETTDSVRFKLYLILPAHNDTTRVLDSLTAMTGRRVYIEHQN
ncbi:hypothetical protein LZZ85_13360 [Terrimonas sp. NA20]|uniref:CCDC81-like prokaryotic HU domain-containing protein n=1 Tax=Terrimonas ginsenosidimutans TaxID=2908004 RepID=A0ABS9KSJ5_9BACT|nr:hypothetical protein [Terrimonas ginsenosidimutans]MCG2615281.1 hypothetical protein [Terrimonas ginsenosidimutans]